MDADVTRKTLTWRQPRRQAAYKILETDDLMLAHDPDEIFIEEDEVPEDGPYHNNDRILQVRILFTVGTISGQN